MTRVTIVGVGALGSHLALLLRNEAIELSVVDMDRVESKNVLSQFHVKQSVGKNKAQALAQALRGFFGGVVTAIPHRLTEDNADLLLCHEALVVDCLDNAASRRLIQRIVRARSIPCLHGALAADGGFGRAVWDPQFVIDEETDAGAATCTNGEHLPFIALTAAYLARAVQQFLMTGQQLGYSISPVGAVAI